LIVGTTYTRPGFETKVRIKSIQTHKKENGRKIKLADAIFTIEYVDSDKPDFTCYERNITSQLTFNLWKLN